VRLTDNANEYLIADAVRIEAIAAGPEIQLLDGTTNIADGTGTVNFGSTPPGTPVSKTLTVKNVGTANLTLTQITQGALPSGYTLLSGFGSLMLAPNASTTFQIRLDAASAGTYTGPVSFANNDSDENPFNFTLTGQVVTGDLLVSIVAASINENGGTTTATVSRSSSTSGNLVVSLLSSDTSEATVPATVTILDGQASANFTVTAVDDSLLDPNITVTITATAAGFTSGTDTVTVIDDDGVWFAVNYTDSAGEGFFDPVLGSTRQNAFEFALDIWHSVLAASYPGETVFIDASFDPLGSGILGGAGPDQIFRDFPGATLADTWYGSALANHLRGQDLNTSSSEINAQFSSNFSNWYYGTDGNTPGGQYDFVTVVLHEVGHGLNFFDLVNQDGTWFAQSRPGIYDRLMINAASGGTALTSMSDSGRASAIISNSLYWFGTEGVSGNGGTRPKLYAPATYSDGSSVSHLDEGVHGNALMSPFISSGQSIHAPNNLELGMMFDMGWTIPAIGGGGGGMLVAGGSESAFGGDNNSVRSRGNTGFRGNSLGISLSLDLDLHFEMLGFNDMQAFGIDVVERVTSATENIASSTFAIPHSSEGHQNGMPASDAFFAVLGESVLKRRRTGAAWNVGLTGLSSNSLDHGDLLEGIFLRRPSDLALW